MVHGNSKCTSLCPECKQDCRCDNCNNCHTCWYKNRHGGDHGHNCAAGENITENSTLLRLSNFAESEAYKVVVGSLKDRKTFFVYKEALSQHSRYFAGLFKFNSEDDRLEVTLDSGSDVDKPAAFAAFIQYAYTGDYYLSNPDIVSDVLGHAHVYVLAERLDAMGLKDLALLKAITSCVKLSSSASTNASKQAGADTTGVGKALPQTTLGVIADVIRIVYENTPSSPAETPTTSASENASEPTSSKKGKASQKGKGASSASSLNPISKDQFRDLISRFSATCLNSLRPFSVFKQCLEEYPEFAQDLMENVTQAKPLEIDPYGQLKRA